MGLQVGVYYSYPPSLHNHQSPSQGGKLSKYGDVFVNPDAIATILTNHSKAIHDALLIDADTLDTEHVAAIVTNARVKAHFPALITDILSDHNKTVHDTLGIDADTVDSKHLPGLIADILSDHSKVIHDALAINADQVDGEEAAAIVTNARVKAHFPDTIANILSNHSKAIHDALGIDAEVANQISGVGTLPNTIASILSDHTKAVHDALAIDADLVDGVHLPSQYTLVLESVGCARAYRNAVQSIPDNALTTIIFNAEDYDNLGAFNTGTGIFTVPAGHSGKYLVKALCYLSMTGDNKTMQLDIWVNGSQKAIYRKKTAGISPETVQVSTIINASVGHTIEIKVKHINGAAVNTGSNNRECFVDIHRLL